MKKAPSRFRKVINRLILVVLGVIIITLAILLYMSPGKTSPITDASGNELSNSIAVIEKPGINGVKQSLIIRGENKNNPVLLFVHGGPGMATFAYIKEPFKGMEKLFTICYWDQRGAGKSYAGDIPDSSMTLEQLTEDGVEVSRYLIKKFNKQKIYLLGHSWGSFLGSFIIHKHPELFAAYIGIGQVANTWPSEQRSFQFVLAEAQKRNDNRLVKELEALKMPLADAPSQAWYNYLMVEREKVFLFGGARYGVKRKLSDLAKMILTCREYTITDKLNYQPGLHFSMHHLWKYMMVNNLNKVLPEQYIPVYIFQGIHDHQTDYGIAKDYFNQLKAPTKRFYSFQHSAHSPHLEEYAAFEKIVKSDVLGLSN
jgi:pimeloyl-ACP methyl ester carboxylesterase